MFKTLIESVQSEPTRFVQDAVGMASVIVIFVVGLHLPALL
ncbi:MAG: hypothetical protein AAF198_08555 [Pseudomonadota bacterium]